MTVEVKVSFGIRTNYIGLLGSICGLYVIARPQFQKTYNLSNLFIAGIFSHDISIFITIDSFLQVLLYKVGI